MWFDEWGFSSAGAPEDAAAYLEGVLRTIAETETGGPSSYLEAIGGIDGQQEFVFQWLTSVGLVHSEGCPRGGHLTDCGYQVLTLMGRGVPLD
jgi:hypothetical protein